MDIVIFSLISSAKDCSMKRSENTTIDLPTFCVVQRGCLVTPRAKNIFGPKNPYTVENVDNKPFPRSRAIL
jgi:hypothetical protein